MLWAAALCFSHPIHGETDAASTSAALTEISGFSKLARKAADENKWQLADHFLGLLAEVEAPDAAKKKEFRAIADDYAKKHQLTRAVAVYEKMVEVYPNDPDTPELIFQLGLLYRNTGVPKLAVARFYTVLNSALKFGSKDLEAYRTLAQRAQWEIADTYFQSGDITKARRYYELLTRLDLSHPDQARARFRLAHCLFLLENAETAIAAAQEFLKAFPEDPAAAECRYLLAVALRNKGRDSEAFETVLALLRGEAPQKEKTPEKWIYWKKKAGNEFANFHYHRGDTLRSLTIFQAIAQLAEEPEWQWPVIYQIGLCFERLRHAGRAAEAYKFIIDEAKKPGREESALPENLRALLESARWRTTQLGWTNGATARLDRLLGNPLASPETQTHKP